MNLMDHSLWQTQNLLFDPHLSLLTQLYISEMAHERVRGMLGSCVQLMVVLGILGAYLAGT